jgi:uncharacterized membrane protein YedE/YeeE
MTAFTPLTASAGGLLIGAAAALLWLACGRVAGVSGILGTALEAPGADGGWRVAFLAGLPLGALLVSALRGGLEIEVGASAPVLAGAGLLVGFGTQLGSGCTSGHGVCGLARGSRRSLVATLTFMATGALTVFVVRHGLAG